MAGTRNTSMRSYDLYSSGTLTANFSDTFIEFADDGDGTKFLSTGMIFICDGTGDLQFSYDGVRVDGYVAAGEQITFDFKKKRQVYLRGAGATPDYRFWAW